MKRLILAALGSATIIGVVLALALGGSRAATPRAHLDPFFTQNPSNPLEVTFDYNATPTKTGESSGNESLPKGVLAFYSNGLLACSNNVGGQEKTGECAVTFGAYGEQKVDVIYASGESSATTGVETVNITAARSTTLTVRITGLKWRLEEPGVEYCGRNIQDQPICETAPAEPRYHLTLSRETLNAAGEPVYPQYATFIDGFGPAGGPYIGILPGEMVTLETEALESPESPYASARSAPFIEAAPTG